jgi:Zn finger protein HypA/HybF involved in hydrogenase expression
MANEKRLIDANALCEGLVENHPVVIYARNAPTVDAVEVVHGEWSTIEDDYVGLVALQCSKCNEEYWFEEELPTKSYNYCPNCGAKMDGDGNEKNS